MECLLEFGRVDLLALNKSELRAVDLARDENIKFLLSNAVPLDELGEQQSAMLVRAEDVHFESSDEDADEAAAAEGGGGKGEEEAGNTAHHVVTMYINEEGKRRLFFVVYK